MSEKQLLRFQHSKMLSSVDVRQMWATLNEEQQQTVLAPQRKLTNGRYPLTLSEVQQLTGIDEGILERELFFYVRFDLGVLCMEAAGLIAAFDLANRS